jgi:hypothetical protein
VKRIYRGGYSAEDGPKPVLPGSDRGLYIGLRRNQSPPDLERVIRARQDELRGRKEDWIDRLLDWWRSYDLARVLIDHLIFVGIFGSVFCFGAAAGAALYAAVHGCS